MSSIHQLEAEEVPRMHPHEVHFWITKYDETGKSLQKHSIDPLAFLDLIAALDFCSLDYQDAALFVRVDNGTILEEVRAKEIRAAVWAICKKLDDPVDGNQLTRKMVLSKILTGIKTLFDEQRLQLIKPEVPYKFVIDEKRTRYTFYKNVAVKVMEGYRTEVIAYPDLDGCIWKKQILPREYVPGAKWEEAVFYKFMQKVCSDDADRVKDLIKITGYLLHGDVSGKAKMINLTDGAVSTGKESNGRSGKSLYAIAIAHAMTSENPTTSKVVTSINGKDFIPSDEHKYQLCGPETRILILNDLKDNFPVKSLYNDVTEGITVNRKYKDPFRVMVKMLVIGNEALRVEGESSIDRILEFEFANFFNSKRSPMTYFGHWFFRDWDKAEWARFDALMQHCIASWLSDCTLPMPTASTLGLRKKREHTSGEFDDYMESLNIQFAPYYDRERDRAFRYEKKEMYAEFMGIYTDYTPRTLSLRKFTEWIATWTKYNPKFKPFETKRDEYRDDKLFYIHFRQAD